MRAVVQRVVRAGVMVPESNHIRTVAEIGQGLLILVGVRTDDTEDDAQWLANKIAGLRVFEDGDGKMNLAIGEVGGQALVVSNFTLYADCLRGRRPGFDAAAGGSKAYDLYRVFGDALLAQGVPTAYGEFGAEMQVSIENDGPVTLVIDSPRRSSEVS